METLFYYVGAAVCGITAGLFLAGLFALLFRMIWFNAKDAHLFITFMREKDNVRRYVDSRKAWKEPKQ